MKAFKLTPEVKRFIDAAKVAGCENSDQIVGFLARQLEEACTWRAISTAPIGRMNGKLIVTNNLSARDAFGFMSHAWVVNMVHKEGGEFVAYHCNGDKIRFLSHWIPLQQPDTHSVQ